MQSTRMLITSLLGSCFFLTAIAAASTNIVSENEEVFPASEVKRTICDYIDKNADKAIFLTRKGTSDDRFDTRNADAHRLLVKKAQIFRAMFKEVIESIKDKDYSIDFIEKAKLDVVEMMRANKGMLLLDEKELEKAKQAFVVKARKNINQPQIKAEKRAAIEKEFAKCVLETAGYAQSLLNDRTIYCCEDLISRGVINLAVELGDGGDLELQLKRKYVRLYLGDLVEQIKSKLLQDFDLVTGNMFYGNSGLERMLDGVRATRPEINEYIEQALQDQNGRIVFMDPKGTLYGLMYQSVQFAYASTLERKALARQCKDRQRTPSPLKTADALMLPGKTKP